MMQRDAQQRPPLELLNHWIDGMAALRSQNLFCSHGSPVPERILGLDHDKMGLTTAQKKRAVREWRAAGISRRESGQNLRHRFLCVGDGHPGPACGAIVIRL